MFMLQGKNTPLLLSLQSQSSGVDRLLELGQSNSNALVVGVGDGHTDLRYANLLGSCGSLTM